MLAGKERLTHFSVGEDTLMPFGEILYEDFHSSCRDDVRHLSKTCHSSPTSTILPLFGFFLNASKMPALILMSATETSLLGTNYIFILMYSPPSNSFDMVSIVTFTPYILEKTF